MHRLEEELTKVTHGGASYESEEAEEGCGSLREATKYLLKFPTSVDGPMDAPVIQHLLGRIQSLLSCCVEVVLFNKMSHFVPLAAPRNDWDFPSDHLPIGAKLRLGKREKNPLGVKIVSWCLLKEVVFFCLNVLVGLTQKEL